MANVVWPLAATIWAFNAWMYAKGRSRVFAFMGVVFGIVGTVSAALS